MQFEEIVAPTMKDAFIKQLETLILSGKLPIGTKLPTERELGEQMKVSKTVVHSGISELARRGFLLVQPRRRVEVANYVENGNLETLMALVRYNGGRLDRRNINSIMEVRMYIEVPAIKKVVWAQDEKQLERLKIIAEKAIELSKAEFIDYKALAMQHYLFHHAICLFSGNTVSPLIFNAFRDVTLPFWETEVRRLGAGNGAWRLQELYELIKSGDETICAQYLVRVLESHMPAIN